MDDKLLRKHLRRDIGTYGWALLIYYLLMNVCVIGAIVVDMVMRTLEGFASGDMDALDSLTTEALLGNAWGYLIACALGVFLIRGWKGKAFFREIFQNGKEMTPGTFWRLLCLFLSGQILFQLLAVVLEWILSFLGLSILESMEAATSGSFSFSMFLYTGIAAPVVEEIVFRGLVLRGLERYGKGPAIVISSILFGMFHGNLVQSPYAFCVGLILGYAAMRYNVFWAMLLHMVNNLVLGDTLPRLTEGLGEYGSALLLQGLVWVCVIVAAVVVVRRRKWIAAQIRSLFVERNLWWAFWTAPGVIVLATVMGFNAYMMLQ